MKTLTSFFTRTKVVELERVVVYSPSELRMKVVSLLYNSKGDYILPYLFDSITIKNSTNEVIVTSYMLRKVVELCMSSRDMSKTWTLTQIEK